MTDKETAEEQRIREQQENGRRLKEAYEKASVDLYRAESDADGSRARAAHGVVDVIALLAEEIQGLCRFLHEHITNTLDAETARRTLDRRLHVLREDRDR
jgi:signal transduction protein with GAF and PtsI domain